MRRIVALGVLALAAAACGEDEGKPKADYVDEPAEPISLTASNRAISLTFHRAIELNHTLAEEYAGQVENVVIEEQLRTQLVRTNPNRPTDTRMDGRLRSIFESERAAPVYQAPQRRTLVVDLMRLDGQWLLDYSSDLQRDALPDAERRSRIAFGVESYREGVRNVLENALEEIEDGAGGPPSAVILGTEMERYWALNRDDWDDFAAFAHETRGWIRELYPDTQVAVGINWSNFIDRVALTYELDEAATAGSPRLYGAMQLAWYDVIDPLYYGDPERGGDGTRKLDFYAFASIPEPGLYPGGPGSIPFAHWGGIPTLFEDSPERAMPVAWYKVGWPVSAASSAATNEFLQRFLEMNGGYPVSLVAWWGFYHFLPEDCAAGPGDPAIGNAPTSYCFRGLFSPTGTPAGAVASGYFGAQ